MLQIVNYNECTGSHELGKGQKIELVMAKEVGNMVLQVFQPHDPDFAFGKPFTERDMDMVLSEVIPWYTCHQEKGECSSIYCSGD